jgi:formylglycine-generating enzyme required for sulfatase activity
MSYDRMTKADAEFATVVKDWPTAAEWAFVCTAHNLLKRIRASV